MNRQKFFGKGLSSSPKYEHEMVSKPRPQGKNDIPHISVGVWPVGMVVFDVVKVVT